MLQEENITMPRWFLENIENTLRIQNNINLDKKTGETCQDRNVKESLNGVRKLLRGEELTGGERLERLQPPLIPSGDEQQEVDLEEEIENYFQGHWPGTETAEQCNTDMRFTPLAIMRIVKHFYELGHKNVK